MLRQIKPHIANSRGQSLVEFTLVLPLLLTIVLGIINFGLISYQLLAANEAAREAARAIAVSGRLADGTAAVKRINPAFQLSSPSIPPDAGSTLSLTVNGSVPLVGPLVTTFLPNPFPIAASASMRMEVAP